MKLENCNPYIRAAEIQPAVLEGTGPRKAYDYRLFYILENSGTIIIDSIRHDIGADTLIILPPATEYYFKGHLKTALLNFDITRRFCHRSQPICPPGVAHFDSRLLFETELLDEFDHPRILNADITVRENILQIVSQFNTRGKYADAAVSAMLKLLFSELLRRSTASENKLCENVVSYIRIHAAVIKSNQDVAEAFGYHPVYLAEVFKQVTGKTLHAAITGEKIRLACRWLTGTDNSIADIADCAGFCSRTHFCTVFKNQMGITPSAYRKNAQKMDMD